MKGTSGMRLDHVGIAVESLHQAARFWSEGMGLEAHPPEHVPELGVLTQKFPTLAGATIELLEEAAGTGGVIAKFLERRGPGVHHLSFEVENLEETTGRLRELGYRIVYEEPRLGAGGYRVNFIHPKDAHGVLLELMEATRAT